jgi:hypothetical protein
MMTDQPSRITPAEIAALLDQASGLRPESPLTDRLAFHERKAALLTRVSATLDTVEAHQVAAAAWDQVCTLFAQRCWTKVAP